MLVMLEQAEASDHVLLDPAECGGTSHKRLGEAVPLLVEAEVVYQK